MIFKKFVTVDINLVTTCHFSKDVNVFSEFTPRKLVSKILFILRTPYQSWGHLIDFNLDMRLY